MFSRRELLVQFGGVLCAAVAARSLQPSRYGLEDVLTYGAVGDGPTDDTPAIQQAIDEAARRAPAIVRLPRREAAYIVSGLLMRSGVTLECEPGALLRARSGLPRNAAVIRIQDVEDAALIGATIDGSRGLQSNGEHRHGVTIRGASRITLRRVIVRNCAGDGIYIGSSARQPFSSHVLLEDCQAVHNRRQGISLVSGSDVHILRARLIDTQGTAPQAGIDLEPNSPEERLERIRITDLYTARNVGGGILIAPRRLNEASTPIDVVISGHCSVEDTMGMRTAAMPSAAPGLILVEDAEYVRPRLHGFLARNWSARGPLIRLVRPVVVDANQSRRRSERYGAAFAVYKSDDDPARPEVIGNVHFEAPRVYDDAGHVSWAFYLRNDVDPDGMADVVLESPVVTGMPARRTLRSAAGVRVAGRSGPPD